MKQEDAVVVLYYNKIRLTEACVRSLLEAGYPAEHIYCFDNGSQPKVLGQVKALFPGCNHHRCEVNNGYSGGFNRSLQWVFDLGRTSALFCTNDTRVYPGALEACAETAQKTGGGLVAPCIIYQSSQDKETHAIDSSGGWFDAETCCLNHYQETGLPELLDPTRDYIPGTALWIHRDFFRECGGTDESFHMYWEDVDLCFRAHQKGLPLARSYGAKIAHGVGQTCRKKPLYTTFYFQRNRIRFCRRYLPRDQWPRARRLLREEFLHQGETWRQREDKKRLGYLEQLLLELEQ